MQSAGKISTIKTRILIIWNVKSCIKQGCGVGVGVVELDFKVFRGIGVGVVKLKKPGVGVGNLNF